jgi:hypothetical protein
MTTVGLLLAVLTIHEAGSAATPAKTGSAVPPAANTGSATPPAANTGSATTTTSPGSTTIKKPTGTTAAAKPTPTNDTQFATELSGYNEVHFSGGGGAQLPALPATLRGAISTKAIGEFTATLNSTGDIIDYELSYSGLESDVTQGHIHFGQPGTVGGIVVWLCQTAGTPAPEPVRDEKITPLCPGPRDGSVKGTITAHQVLEVTGQGIAAKEFDELVRALQNRTGYANVHTQAFPQGEIRGQIGVINETLPGDTSPTLR